MTTTLQPGDKARFTLDFVVPELDRDGDICLELPYGPVYLKPDDGHLTLLERPKPALKVGDTIGHSGWKSDGPTYADLSLPSGTLIGSDGVPEWVVTEAGLIGLASPIGQPHPLEDMWFLREIIHLPA